MTPEDLDKLSPELADLLEAEAKHSDMPPEAPARLFASVSTAVGISLTGGAGGGGGRGGGGSEGHGGPSGGSAGPSAGAPTTPASGATASAWSMAKAAIVAAFGSGAVVGALAHAGYERVTTPSPTRAVTIAPTAIAPPAPAPNPSTPPDAPPMPAITAPLSSVAPPRPTAPAISGRVSDDTSEDQALATERAHLETARTALARGQADAALAALGRHAQRFPHGRLAEERDSLWVQALMLGGHTAEAQQRAAVFRKLYPKSLFLPVVEAALGTPSTTP